MENSVIELYKTTEQNTPEINVIQDIHDPYAYLTSDCKKLNFQLKNLQIIHPEKTEYSYITKKYETTPIWELSEKTKKFVEKQK